MFNSCWVRLRISSARPASGHDRIDACAAGLGVLATFQDEDAGALAPDLPVAVDVERTHGAAGVVVARGEDAPQASLDAVDRPELRTGAAGVFLFERLVEDQLDFAAGRFVRLGLLAGSV